MKTFVPGIILLLFFNFSWAQLSLQDSLVAHYPLDGNVLDISGNGNHGSVHGAALTTDRFGSPNSAYQFDGIDDYIDLLANQKFKPQQFPVTISTWIELQDYNFNLVFRNDFEEDRYNGIWLNMVNGRTVAAYGDGGVISPNSRRSVSGSTTLALLEWKHIAVIIRGPQDMDVYVDGNFDCGTYSGFGSTLAYSSNNGNFGRDDDQNGAGGLIYYKGKIDEFRFYNRELSLDELRFLANYQNTSTLNVCQGSQNILDADNGSASYQWSPSQGLSCTNCPTPTASPNDSTTYRLIRTNSRGCPDTTFYQVHVRNCNLSVCDPSFSLQDSLIAHYPLDGNALDVSANGNHGTPVGATLTTDRFGNANSAYQFDGVDDYIDLLSNQKFKPQQFPVTVTAWIELADHDFNLIFRNDFIENQRTGIYVSNQNGITGALYGDGGPVSPAGRRTKFGTSVAPLFSWTHVAIIIRGPLDMDIYYNGNNDCGTYSGTGGNMVYSNNNGNLGRNDGFTSSGPLYFFNGKMDDIRFYSRELCINEIRTLADYNNLQTFNICSGDTAILNGDDGSSSYQWSPAPGLSCTTCPNPQAFPTDTTLFQLVRTNALGCPDTSFFQVNPESCQFASPCDTTTLQANFDYTSNGLVLTAMDASIGPDSGIDRWRWDFGDGNRRSVFQTDTIDHQYFLPGSYNVCLTVEKFYDELNVCLDTFCQLVMVDSLASSYGQELSPFGWQLYPNPVRHSFLLGKALFYSGKLNISIFNTNGQQVLKKETAFREQLEISVKELPKGIYIIQVEDEKNIGYLKFMKE
ncbi:MAG: LamG-like jellyroll fold domain-containing protein [Bacteroidia bacterium]|nr:LamG-like jellyroll fold domain-containing protein [Bacteroidia bacterium]